MVVVNGFSVRTAAGKLKGKVIFMAYEKKKDMYELSAMNGKSCFWIAIHPLPRRFAGGDVFRLSVYDDAGPGDCAGAGSPVYLGNSAPVESRRVIEDVALRATYALLCDGMTFAANGQSRLFSPRSVRPKGISTIRKRCLMTAKYLEVTSAKVEIAVVNGRYHALVRAYCSATESTSGTPICTNATLP